MAVTAQQLTELYLAYFGRPPDYSGIVFYTSNPDATMTSVAAAFSASPESKALYGATFNAAQLNAIYQNLFNRDAEAAGVSYWTGEVSAGRITPAGAALAILQGAQNADATAVQNKLALATQFYSQLDTTAEITGYSGAAAAKIARDFLHTVDSTQASLTGAQAGLVAAVAAVVGQGPIGGVPGTSFALTVGVDDLAGASLNDVFDAPLIAGSGANTLNSSDILRGGEGTDTLNVTVSSASASPTLKDIEVINAKFTGGVTLGLGNATGVTAVNIAGSTGIALVTGWNAIGALSVKNQNQDVQISNDSVATLALTLDKVGSASSLNNITFVSASPATVNVSTSNAHVQLDNFSNAATVSIAASGDNTLDLQDTVGALKSVTVSGSGTVSLGTTTLSAVTTLNAGVNAGGVTAKLGAAALTVTGGAGQDHIAYTAAIAATAKVDLGGGNDTLTVVAASAAGASIKGGNGTDTLKASNATYLAGGSKIFSAFEVLEIAGGQGTYDLSQVSSVNSVSVTGADLSATSVLSNAAAGTTLAISSAKGANLGISKDLTYTLKDASGSSDAMAVTLTAVDADDDSSAEGHVTVSKLVADGIETISIVSNATTDSGLTEAQYTNTITLLDADAVETLNLSGSASTTIIGITGTTLTDVDASAATGAVAMDASSQAQAVTFVGGSANDTYAATTHGDTITAGAGADTIALDASHAAVDTLIFEDGDSVLTSKANGHDRVSDFGTTAGGGSKDKIDVSAFGFNATLGAKGALANAVVNGSTLSATGFFTVSSVQHGVVAGTNGGNTYVFIDVNGDNNFTAASDLMVELVGVTDVDVANFTF